MLWGLEVHLKSKCWYAKLAAQSLLSEDLLCQLLPNVANAQSEFAMFCALKSTAFLMASSLKASKVSVPGLWEIFANAHSVLARFLAVNLSIFAPASIDPEIEGEALMGVWVGTTMHYMPQQSFLIFAHSHKGSISAKLCRLALYEIMFPVEEAPSNLPAAFILPVQTKADNSLIALRRAANSCLSLRARYSAGDPLKEAMVWSAVAIHTASKLCRDSLIWKRISCTTHSTRDSGI